MDDKNFASTRVLAPAQQIIDVIDPVCEERWDEEYALLARRLVARLARSGRRSRLAGTHGSGRRACCACWPR